MELISIIIPIYNTEKYLDECLYSVVNQTYSNIEILLIDDGSTDNSGVICDEWSKKDKRIKVFHKENGGPAFARNVGLDNCEGDFIFFCDSDDSMRADLLESLKLSISINNSQLACCGIYGVFLDNGNYIEPHFYGYESEVIDVLEYMESIIKNGDFILWNKLFVSKYIKNLRFDESLILGEDLKFVYGYLDNIKKISYVKKHLYYHKNIKNTLTDKLNKYDCLKALKAKFFVDSILNKYDIKSRYEYRAECICNLVKYKAKIGNNFDYSEYELIIDEYKRAKIFHNLKGIRNKLKVFLAIYLPKIYIKLSRF